MGKEHSHDVIRRLIAGKEEDVMRGLRIPYPPGSHYSSPHKCKCEV